MMSVIWSTQPNLSFAQDYDYGYDYDYDDNYSEYYNEYPNNTNTSPDPANSTDELNQANYQSNAQNYQNYQNYPNYQTNYAESPPPEYGNYSTNNMPASDNPAGQSNNTYSNYSPPPPSTSSAQTSPLGATAETSSHSTQPPAAANSTQLNADHQLNLDTIILPPELATIKPPHSTLGTLAPGEAPHHYVIQPGDTLYDICDQLLDEPQYWPKLWSLNPEIKNPHFVWPGMILRFYPGDDFLPPYLEIKEAEDLDPVYLDDDFTPESLVVSPLILENEEQPFYPPPALPDLMTSAEIAALPNFPVDITQSLARQIQVDLPFFVFRKKIKNIGTIVGSILDGYSLKSDGLLLANSQLQEGKTYSVVRFSHRINNPHNQRFIGFQYTNLGDIVIKETHTNGLKVARDAYAKDPVGQLMPLKHRLNSMAIYKITNVLGFIQKGDMVIEKIPSRFNIPHRPKSKGRAAEASVVSFTESHQKISRNNEFMVLNNSNLQTGEEISLYKERRLIDNLRGLKKYYQFGVARVIKVSDAATIAYIMQANSSVMLGDRCTPTPP